MLKLDPKNTELLAQKQKLLKEAISNTESRLEALRKANDKVKGTVKNYDEWEKAYKPIKEEIDSTTKKIKELKSEMLDMSAAGKVDTTEYKNLQRQLDESNSKLKDLKKQAKKTNEEFGNPISTEQYDALQREIVETESDLKSLKEQAKTAKKSISNLSGGLEAAKGLLKKVGNVGKGAAKGITFVTGAATAGSAGIKALVESTEELRTDLSRLDANARESGVGIDVTRESFKAFNLIVDEVDSSVEGVSNLLQAGFTESNLQKAVEGLTGAYLKFPDTLKIESLADSLQETLASGKSTGQFAELLDRLGKGTDDFNEKLQSLSSETDKQNYALQVLADAGLNDTYNQYLKNNEALIKSKEANQEYEESVANLSERLVPISTKITNTMTKIIDKTAGVLDYLLDIAERIQSGDLSIEEALQKVVGDGTEIVGKFIQGILEKLPRLKTIAGDLISNLSVGIKENLPSFISKGLDIVTGLSSNVRNNIGMIVNNGIELIMALGNGIIESLPTLIEKVPQIVIEIAGVINDNAPKLLFAGIELIGKLIVGLISSIPTLIANLPKIIEAIVATIMAFNWLNLGSKIMNGISNGVKKMGIELKNAFTNGFKGALEYIKALPGRAVTWGKDFVQGMINGIKSKVSGIVNSVKGIASKIASYLHFSRPDVGPLHYYEEWMPDFLDGLAKGINKNAYKVNNAVKNLASGIEAKMNVYTEPATTNISVSAPTVTVMVGNKQFDGYIVKTATNGINSVQASMMKAKGLK